MSSATAGVKSTHPSATRNCEPISHGLLKQIDVAAPNLKLLEIASGSGQHAGYFAPLFPNVTFQPTEFDRTHFDSIRAYAADCPTKNILEPIFVDISKDIGQSEEHKFAAGSYDYMLNCNMMHISPWQCSLGLFQAAAHILKPGGCLFTYGPYAFDGVLKPESNVEFDKSLKQRNPEWGIRDVEQLKTAAGVHDFKLENIMEMPSNNHLLTWRKPNESN